MPDVQLSMDFDLAGDPLPPAPAPADLEPAPPAPRAPTLLERVLLAGVERDERSGAERKRQGQDRTWGAQSVVWQATALEAVEALLRREPEITGDDVRAVVPGTPSHPNAWGALMRAVAAKRDPRWVERTGRQKPSERDDAHKRMLDIWRSLLYRPGQPAAVAA